MKPHEMTKQIKPAFMPIKAEHDNEQPKTKTQNKTTDWLSTSLVAIASDYKSKTQFKTGKNNIKHQNIVIVTCKVFNRRETERK